MSCMNRSFSIVQLRSLVAVADAGGFGRAAKALHLSQSTISQHLGSLEKQLGVPLSERHGRQNRFTAAGEQLIIEARRILQVHDEALARLEQSRDRPIVIGSTETAVTPVLPQLLRALNRTYPGRRAQFHIDRSTRMSEEIARGGIDLAVVLGFPSETVGHRVGSLPLAWFAAPDCSTFKDAEVLPLVAYFEPCGMRQRALVQLNAAQRRHEVVAESSTLEGVVAAAQAGLGVAVLPVGRDEPAGLKRITGLPDLGEIGVYVSARQGLEQEITELAQTELTAFFTNPE